MENIRDLITIFEAEGIQLSGQQAEQFLTYYEMLIKKNEVMNLTAITEYREVLIKHFLDSCMLLKFKQDFENIIDVGTGAGFPGLPLKIMLPDTEVMLLDSLNKRINFIEEVRAALELPKLTLVHARAEDGAVKYRGQFDAAVSRAVANLSTLSEYCLPYVKKDGLFIAYKSGDVEDEVKSAANALKILGGRCERIEKFSLPDGAGDRSLVFIRKEKDTPKKYPRKAGTPAKEPL